MNWSRTEQQLVVRLQGAAPEDGRVLVLHLGQLLMFELEERGYDLRTFRFSIRKRKAGQQLESYEEDIA